MAKFKYRLQNILDIKIRLETQAKTEFATAMNALQAEEDRMRELLIKKQRCQDDMRSSALGRVDVIQLRIGTSSVKAVDEMIKQQIVKVRIAEKNLEKAREQLNEAVKERKIHEKLKEKAFEEFKIELNDEEKKEIDQLVSFTYNDKGKNTD